MNAEQYIKSRLDGRFFRLDLATGKVIETEVAHDHIPDHKPQMIYDIVPTDPAHMHHNCKPFSAEEDEYIIEMRGKGDRWENIARRMKRSIANVRMHYGDLCMERGIEPQKAVSKAYRLPEEAKREIIRMRALGMAFPEINKALGLNEYSARDFYRRYLEKMRSAA